MQAVNRGEFLRNLEMCAPGVSSTGIAEQSSAFVFDAGLVTTFNDEIACRIKSGLDESFKGAVESKPLLELLHKLTEDEIAVEIADSTLSVIGKRRRADFNLEAEVLLQTESLEKPGKWFKLDPEFGESIKVVGNCSGRSDVYGYVNCVHLHPRKIEAQDAAQFCSWKIGTGFEKASLVRRDSLKHVVPLGMTKASETDNWLHFRNQAGLVMSCRKYLDEFPDRSKLFDVEGEEVAFPKGLVEELDKAQVFSRENESDRVKVTVKPGKVIVEGIGVHGKYTARPKVNYNGKPMSFLIAPDMLAEVVKQGNVCVVGKDRLTVTNGKYRYLACLVSSEEEPKTSPSGNKHEDNEN
jgi:hypothetical protein